jgi:collagen triple helix repeat protein
MQQKSLRLLFILSLLASRTIAAEQLSMGYDSGINGSRAQCDSEFVYLDENVSRSIIELRNLLPNHEWSELFKDLCLDIEDEGNIALYEQVDYIIQECLAVLDKECDDGQLRSVQTRLKKYKVLLDSGVAHIQLSENGYESEQLQTKGKKVEKICKLLVGCLAVNSCLSVSGSLFVNGVNFSNLTTIAGAIGAAGLAGPPGPQGPSGPQGTQGIQGPQGPIGLGLLGAQGIQGIQGIQGLTGPQGPIGLTGPAGAQGIPGPVGATGATGATGVVGAAEFIRTIQSPNNSVPPGTAFTIDTQVLNNIPLNIVASAGAGGTVFTLTAGTYVIDYEMSLGAAGSVAIYKGATAGTLAIDPNTVAGSSTATTWIHGRALEVVATSLVIAISSVVGTAAVVTAGTDAGSFMIRLTILKIA